MGKAARLGLAPRDHQALRHQHVMKAPDLDLLPVDRTMFERHNARIDMAKTMLVKYSYKSVHALMKSNSERRISNCT